MAWRQIAQSAAPTPGPLKRSPGKRPRPSPFPYRVSRRPGVFMCPPGLLVPTRIPTVNVTFGAIVEVAFTIRCVAAGRLRVTTATTGTYLDPDGYGLTIYLPGTNTFTHTSVSTNGTVTFSGPVGDYLLTLLEIMPNCNTVLPNPRVVAVTAGSETSVTIDVACDAPSEIAFV